jgi:tetratricopeptide (TPR) repeat protein
MPVACQRRQSWLKLHWPQSLVALALAAAGFAAGWLLAPARPERTRVVVSNPLAEQWNLPALTAPQQQSLDEAFAAFKAAHYDVAERKFADLLKQQPLWTALNSDRACAAVYRYDEATFLSLVKQGQKDGSLSAADGKLLTALRRVGIGHLKAAAESFAEAAAADPTRADIFDQWGLCLLRWGKPAAAAENFHAAWLRNSFPIMDELYRTEFLLAQIQAGQDTPGGLGPRLDEALADPEPSSAALFAGAARAVRANRFDEAAAWLERARRVTAPSMYLVLLYSPFFNQDRSRPELAPLYLAAEKAQADALRLQGDE